MKTVIMDMSGNYQMLLDYFENIPDKNVIHFDLTSVQGTSFMLDPFAYTKIASDISDIDPGGIHFLDSGNYHYLSYLWLEKIKKEFSLLLFDNHPDTTEPMENGLLECGSWVKEGCRNLKNLKNVYILGAAPAHIDAASPLPEKVKIISDVCEIPSDTLLYISIDKDVLSPEYAACDWDQGQMSLDELLLQLHKLNTMDIIGVDICGEKKSQPEFGELSINHKTNLALLDEIKPFFS